MYRDLIIFAQYRATLLYLILFLFLIFSTSPSLGQDQDILSSGFDVQGHRGARGLQPENTLPSFETALDLEVTTLELDLHFSADGVVVIWHDDYIQSDKCGLKGNPEIDAPNPDSLIAQGDKLLISQLTWEQIQAYQCDRNPEKSRFDSQDNQPTVLAGNSYGIPSLDDLFEFVETYAESDLKTASQRENASLVQFNIETKRKFDFPQGIGDDFDGENAGAFELAILDIVAEHELEDRVIIQSFDHRSLLAIRQINDSIQLAALTSRYIPDLEELSQQGIMIWSPNYRGLNQDLVEEAHELGLRVIPWTVNDNEDMAVLIEVGVDGIITDYPDRLMEIVTEKK